MTVSIGCVADLDAAIAAGLLPDNKATRDLRAHLVNPKIIHVDQLGGCKPEFQAFLDSIPEDRITANNISLTGLGECAITIGENAEIVSIVKADGTAVAVPPVKSSTRN
jgi:hypothetical protein